MPSNSPELSVPPSRSRPAEYLVVARRYRPRNFEELIGQGQSAQALRNAITTNRVGHAYLFTGARGVGKTSTARIFAKALNCVNGPTTHPCDTCDICQGIATGEDVDVLEIDGASNRGIDEIRQLRSNVNVRPSRARFKIYIIDEVHMLTTPAFNALLKTLEEPPEHVKFIFCTTDPEKIPITVLSRCQRFDFVPVDAQSIMARLQQIIDNEGVTAEPEALQLLARRANGSLRDSQSLLEQLLSFCSGTITVGDVHRMLGIAPVGRLAEITRHLLDRHAAGALNDLNSAIADGVDPGQLCEQLLGYFRDLMAASCGCSADLMLHTTGADFAELQAVSAKLGLETILAVVQILDQTLNRMRFSTHVRTLVEISLVRICNLENLDQISELIARLADGSVPAPGAGAPGAGAPGAGAPGAGAPGSSAPGSAAPAPAAQKKNESAALNPVATPAAAISPQPITSLSARSTPSGSTASRMVAPASPTSAAAVEIGPSAGREAEPAAASPAPVAASEFTDDGNVPVETDAAARAWRQALEDMNDMTSAAASQATQVAIAADGRLRVGFPGRQALQRELCERPDRRSRLEEAVGKILGRQIRIDFVSVGDAPRPEESAAPAMSRNQRIRELQRSPFVAKAIELFDGEVLRVDEVRGRPD